jgi:hypothetical protein
MKKTKLTKHTKQIIFDSISLSFAKKYNVELMKREGKEEDLEFFNLQLEIIQKEIKFYADLLINN